MPPIIQRIALSKISARDDQDDAKSDHVFLPGQGLVSIATLSARSPRNYEAREHSSPASRNGRASPARGPAGPRVSASGQPAQSRCPAGMKVGASWALPVQTRGVGLMGIGPAAWQLGGPPQAVGARRKRALSLRSGGDSARDLSPRR